MIEWRFSVNREWETKFYKLYHHHNTTSMDNIGKYVTDQITKYAMADRIFSDFIYIMTIERINLYVGPDMMTYSIALGYNMESNDPRLTTFIEQITAMSDFHSMNEEMGNENYIYNRAFDPAITIEIDKEKKFILFVLANNLLADVVPFNADGFNFSFRRNMPETWLSNFFSLYNGIITLITGGTDNRDVVKMKDGS